jgi:hypothetical protein
LWGKSHELALQGAGWTRAEIIVAESRHQQQVGRKALTDRVKALLARRDLASLLTPMPGRARVAVEVAWVVHALVGVPVGGHLLLAASAVDIEAWWRVCNS